MKFRITAVVVNRHGGAQHHFDIERDLSHSFQVLEALEAHICEVFDLSEAPDEYSVLWVTAMYCGEPAGEYAGLMAP